jgi:hypothetical protein
VIPSSDLAADRLRQSGTELGYHLATIFARIPLFESPSIDGKNHIAHPELVEKQENYPMFIACAEIPPSPPDSLSCRENPPVGGGFSQNSRNSEGVVLEPDEREWPAFSLRAISSRFLRSGDQQSSFTTYRWANAKQSRPLAHGCDQIGAGFRTKNCQRLICS